jgi:hypothetical protein
MEVKVIKVLQVSKVLRDYKAQQVFQGLRV